jgi:hypothetical protein
MVSRILAAVGLSLRRGYAAKAFPALQKAHRVRGGVSTCRIRKVNWVSRPG